MKAAIAVGLWMLLSASSPSPSPSPSQVGWAGPASEHWDTLSGEFEVSVKVWSRLLHHPDLYRGRALSQGTAGARELRQSITMGPGRTHVGPIEGSLRLEGDGGRVVGSWTAGATALRLEGKLGSGAKTVVLRGRVGAPGTPAYLVEYEVDWRVLDGGGHLFTAYIKVPSVGRVRIAQARLAPRAAATPSKDERPK